MTAASLTAVARHLNFVRETLGTNLGAWVQKFQRETGGVPGESWCADFLYFVEDTASFGQPRLPKTGSCQEMLDASRQKGYEVPTPQQDDVFFRVNKQGHAHHCGIVTGISPNLTGIAGNTSEDGLSDNGTGVFEHSISPNNIVFVRLPKEIQ